MPTQHSIAAALGLTQATVSMALRGDPSIPAATRKRVEELARQMGYRPNPMISALMGHIRTGKVIQDQGCIAILVDAGSEKEWLNETYKLFYEGYCQQAKRCGYVTECFYLRAPGTSAARIHRQLQARGILGLILAAPRRFPNEPVEIDWSRYACATTSYTWTLPRVDRVSTHHRHNLEIAFAEVLKRGYRRIGLCLPENALYGVDSSWHAGYLVQQSRLPPAQRLPPFIGSPPTVSLSKFRAWYRRWKPDALIGLSGEELEWMNAMGLTTDDLGLACINRPLGSHFSGVEENDRIVGEKTCALVVNQILHNERGLPMYPQYILIEGTWTEGSTLPDRTRRLVKRLYR